MTDRNQVIRSIEENKIIVIMRGFSTEQLIASVDAMEKGGIGHMRSLYSPNLMRTQIKAIDDLLMDRDYFGE